jgi:hypothetical protein
LPVVGRGGGCVEDNNGDGNVRLVGSTGARVGVAVIAGVGVGVGVGVEAGGIAVEVGGAGSAKLIQVSKSRVKQT